MGLPLLKTVALFSSLLFAHAAPINPSFPYGSQKVRGVNLGGWLVLEPWITPSLFDNTGNSKIIDEWTFGQLQDRGAASAALKQHWDTWITEKDFADIAAAGLNHVRLPIGYWAWDVSGGEPFIQGQLPYMDKAVQWARNHNLKLIIDLHGAPGSQNGYDNSGQKLDAPTWQTRQRNIDRTNAIIKKIADLYKDQTAVVPIIAPLNEPAGWYSQQVLDVTRQFWYDSYGNVRFPYGSDRQSNTVLMIHDAFQTLDYWRGFMRPPSWEGVIMDTHIYQMFSPEGVAQTNNQHIQSACARGDSLADFSANSLWTVVGEWTPTGNDCAKYLNGRGIGNRYEGTYPGSTRVGSCQGRTGTASQLSDSTKRFLRRFWEAQTITYEKGAGWIQWTWKTEVAAEWSYKSGLENGWIPQNPTDRQNPDICG